MSSVGAASEGKLVSLAASSPFAHDEAYASREITEVSFPYYLYLPLSWRCRGLHIELRDD